MAADSYDALARVLRELPGRFGPTVFSDRRRVVSVLSDRVPEARREIKVLRSALDDGVFDALSNARPEQIGLEIDRLAARIEANLGIRSDIALPVIRACAHGLGRGPLPSEYGHAAMGYAPPVPRSQPEGSWVGVSQPVGGLPPGASPSAPIPRYTPEGSWVGVSAPVGAPPQNPQHGGWGMAQPGMVPHQGHPGPGYPGVGYPGAAPPGQRPAGRPEWVKWVLIGGGALVGIVALVIAIGALSPDPDPTPKPPDPPKAGPGEVKPPVGDRKTTPPVEDRKPPRVDPGKARPDQAQRDDNPTGPPVTPPSPPKTTTPAPPVAPGATYAEETADFGVPPQRTLQTNIGSPTPNSIPVGSILLTHQINEEVRKGTQFLLVDVLESPHPQTIVNARYIPYGGRPGTFTDQIQKQLVSDLAGLTRNNQLHPIVFFCYGVRCWESYNAVLRAYEAGYRNIYWYRGGIAAWQAAGLPMQPLPGR